MHFDRQKDRQRVRNRFTPALREQVFRRIKPLIITARPFVNLPESKKGRWGEGLTAEDIEACQWVRPELVAQIEYVNWTEADHLRHSRFVALREDGNPREVGRG